MLRCSEPLFQEWLCASYGAEWDRAAAEHGAHDHESAAKGAICEICRIKSRKELDTDPRAARVFHQAIREPYAAFNAEG